MGSELEAPYDEAWSRPGVPREHYAPLIAALQSANLARLAAEVADCLSRNGVRFGESAFVIDPVPRIIPAEEWHGLERGLAQRARALNLFLRDAYSEQRVLSERVVPRVVLESAEGFEADLVGRLAPQRWPAAIIGFDVVRGREGEYLVLEDNLRTPSGFGYALAARMALMATLPQGLPEPHPLEPTVWELLSSVMRAAAPAGVSEPAVVVLTDGPHNIAYYEHRLAAERLGAVLATPDQLAIDDGFLGVRDENGTVSRIDVVYRRTNEDRVRDEHGELTPVAQRVLEPWLSGKLGLVNAFGNGVADDKLIHSHVEDFIRFYLNEEPLLRSVPTSAVGRDPETIVERLDELVVKPRHGHGGIGVLVGPHADAEDLARLADELRQDPTAYIAQPTITLSVHPTIVGDQLGLRHVDLRPFSFGEQLLPGGLSRVAFDEGALVVNSSQNGGGKDTWVMPD